MKSIRLGQRQIPLTPLFPLFSSLLLAAVISTGCNSSNSRSDRPSEKPDFESNVVTGDIEREIKGHIEEQVRLGKGYFKLSFKDEELQLKLVRIHVEYLATLGPTSHFACVDLAGVDGPGEQIDGVSLKPVLDGKTEQIHDFVVGYFRNFQRMIRTDDWKYIEYPAVDRQQLFHLKTDPDERVNLIAVAAHAAVKEQLKTQMRDWFRKQGDSVYVGADAEK